MCPFQMAPCPFENLSRTLEILSMSVMGFQEKKIGMVCELYPVSFWIFEKKINSAKPLTSKLSLSGWAGLMFPASSATAIASRLTLFTQSFQVTTGGSASGRSQIIGTLSPSTPVLSTSSIPSDSETRRENETRNVRQGPYSNKEIQIQYLPGWIELNCQDISDAVYETSVAINRLKYFLQGVSAANLVHICNKTNVL